MASATGQFNIGRDATLIMIRPGGVALRPTEITNFDAKQIVTDLKSRPLNGPPLHAYLPDGWEGSFDYDRADSRLDDYFSQLEVNFYSGLGLEQVIIQQTIREVSGAVTQYRFDRVALKLDSAGAWKADSKVETKLGFMASTRTKVA